MSLGEWSGHSADANSLAHAGAVDGAVRNDRCNTRERAALLTMEQQFMSVSCHTLEPHHSCSNIKGRLAMKVARPPLLHQRQLALSQRHPHQQLDSDFADESGSIHAKRSTGWRGSFLLTHDTVFAHGSVAELESYGDNADGIATVITGNVLPCVSAQEAPHNALSSQLQLVLILRASCVLRLTNTDEPAYLFTTADILTGLRGALEDLPQIYPQHCETVWASSSS